MPHFIVGGWRHRGPKGKYVATHEAFECKKMKHKCSGFQVEHPRLWSRLSVHLSSVITMCGRDFVSLISAAGGKA